MSDCRLLLPAIIVIMGLLLNPRTCPARFDPIDTDLADPIPGDLMRPTDSGIEPSTLGCARKGLTVSPA